METYHTIVRFLQEGGVFIYPIMIVLALGLAIAMERFLYLSSTKSANGALTNTLPNRPMPTFPMYWSCRQTNAPPAMRKTPLEIRHTAWGGAPNICGRNGNSEKARARG